MTARRLTVADIRAARGTRLAAPHERITTQNLRGLKHLPVSS